MQREKVKKTGVYDILVPRMEMGRAHYKNRRQRAVNRNQRMAISTGKKSKKTTKGEMEG